MAFKWVNEGASVGVPYFAGSIIASGDEFISVFVKAAVGEG